MHNQELDFTIERLGECRFPSPMRGGRFTADDERILYHARFDEIKAFLDTGVKPPAMEAGRAAGADLLRPGAAIACGIVTCGGLCPGINDVIRAVTLSLYHHYGVRQIYGFRYGYEGLVKRLGHTPLRADPRIGERHRRTGRDDPGILAGPAGPGRDGRQPGGAGGRHPLRHRRRRHPQGGRRHRRRRPAGGDCRSASSASPRPSTTTSPSSRRPSVSKPPWPRRSGPSTPPTPRPPGRATASAW